DLSAIFRDRDKPFKTKKISVSKDWKRYEIKLPAYPNAKLAIMVKPLDSGKLWVDAVQIESGLKPTEFKASHFDSGFTKPQQAIHLGLKAGKKAPTLHLSPLSGAVPTIDGDISDAAWKNAVEFTMGTMVGAPSETPTKGKVACDGKTMYISFDCEDPRGTNGKGESIEVFFDIFGIGSPYYQFIFDASGKKSNYRSLNGKHEWDWKADWKVATKKRKNGWTAEVAVPLSAMPDTAVVANLDSIKMNFCRNYSAGPELHLAWAPVHGTFLEPENFGTVYLSGKAAASFAVDEVDLVSTNASDDKFELRIDTKNSFKKEGPVFASVVMETKTAAAQTRTAKFALQSGKSQVLNFKGFKLAG
ncbi:MAG: hypothetical protein KAG97_13605, partial [Victivallales bacterium]|nr:hypothetical protein [Victivallales bacterium]